MTQFLWSRFWDHFALIVDRLAGRLPGWDRNRNPWVGTEMIDARLYNACITCLDSPVYMNIQEINEENKETRIRMVRRRSRPRSSQRTVSARRLNSFLKCICPDPEPACPESPSGQALPAGNRIPQISSARCAACPLSGAWVGGAAAMRGA